MADRSVDEGQEPRKRLKTDRDYAGEARRPDKYTRQRRKAAQAAEASNSGGTGGSGVGRTQRPDAPGTPRPLTVYGGPREPAWPPPTPPEGRRSTGPGSEDDAGRSRVPEPRTPTPPPPGSPSPAREAIPAPSTPPACPDDMASHGDRCQMEGPHLVASDEEDLQTGLPDPPITEVSQAELLRLLVHRRPRRCLLWVYGSPAESTWHAQWSHQWSPRNQGSLRALLDVCFR